MSTVGRVAALRVLKGAVDSFATAEELRALAARAEKVEEEIGLPYLLENIPRAFECAIEGLERVTTIVRSMKEFAHPSQKAMAWSDLNRAIQATLTVARNEYKYVADLAVELGTIPPVNCHVSEINQVVLNILVNAAHAIEDVVRGTEHKGLIRVTTRVDGDDVVIAIADTGGGIPDAVRVRVFDPFFTTKEVGRGTGQGLAMAKTIVREKHGGELTFDTELGKGTTFFIRLPIQGKKQSVRGEREESFEHDAAALDANANHGNRSLT